MMKSGSFFILLLLVAGISAGAVVLFQRFDKAAFYSTMASGTIDAVNSGLDAVKNAPAKEQDGYEGALLMRKAGLVKSNKEKLKFFKSGRIKLETALLADSTNLEFRFLRLAIQEHAPRIVKYRKEINKDMLYIKKHYKASPLVVQHAIMDYSRSSKVLHPEDL